MLCISQSIAMIFLLGLIGFTALYVYPNYREVRGENAEFRLPHTSHISFNYNIHKYNGLIDIDLKTDYPHGILIVNDPITFSGIVDASQFPINITSFMVLFQNAQAYPIIQNNKGITKLAEIIFHRTQDSNVFVANETVVVWTLDRSL